MVRFVSTRLRCWDKDWCLTQSHIAFRLWFFEVINSTKGESFSQQKCQLSFHSIIARYSADWIRKR